MSRGPGKWQLAILRALRKPGLFPLRGATAAETAALVHAALTLEGSGQCVVVRRRSDEGGRSLRFAAPPGTTVPEE
jgi:hypothetical protein